MRFYEISLNRVHFKQQIISKTSEKNVLAVMVFSKKKFQYSKTSLGKNHSSSVIDNSRKLYTYQCKMLDKLSQYYSKRSEKTSFQTKISFF